jgi:hypothetical protein
VDDGSGELVGGGIAAEILCSDLASLQDVVNGIVDLRTVLKQVDVTQHLRGAQQHGTGISDVLADTFSECVTRTLKKFIFYLVSTVQSEKVLTGSYTTCSDEYEAPLTTPAPPTKPEAMLSMMFP